MAKPEISAFRPTRSLSLYYERSLRKIARNIGDITNAMGLSSQTDPQPLIDVLNRYAHTLEPWAESIAQRMVADAERANSRQWKSYAATMGRELRHEIENTDTGKAMRDLMNYQVTLIKSIPLEAAKRVQRIASESLITGARFDELRDELMKTGEVTKSRATLIARTETSRASAILTQVRAQAIGSEEYVWRSHKDARTRPSHRACNGKVFRWDSPPTLDNLTGGPGETPNCRCFAVPIIP